MAIAGRCRICGRPVREETDNRPRAVIVCHLALIAIVQLLVPGFMASLEDFASPGRLRQPDMYDDNTTWCKFLVGIMYYPPVTMAIDVVVMAVE